MSRVAVVTGAARGFGRAIAEGLAARGDRVVAVDVRDPVETAASIDAAGGICFAEVADVSSPDAVAGLAERVHAELGECGILVNNAGLMRSTPFLELDYDAWSELLRANLDSQFLTAKAFAPDMVEAGWGRIVNVSSSSLRTATPGITAYMASKGGVVGLTSGLANDLGPHGITVNAVSPGFTVTPGVEEDIRAGRVPPGAEAAIVAQQAIPRPGTPRDLVGAVLFLASEDASFLTGQFLVVDGGMTR